MKKLIFLVLLTSQLLFPQEQDSIVVSEENPALKTVQQVYNAMVFNEFFDRPLHLSVSPFFLFYEGFKINIEYKKPNSPIGYHFAPSLYSGDLSDDDFTYDMWNPSRAEVLGVGVEGMIKYYVSKNLQTDNINAYIGLQGFYLFGSIRGEKDFLQQINQDGVPVLLPSRGNVDISTHRVSFNLAFGLDYIFNSYFSIESTLFYGINIASVSESQPVLNEFNDEFFTINGNDYFLDIKIGVWLENIFKDVKN